TSPSLGVSRPARHRMSVVLPAPLGPITVTLSPRCTSKLTPRNSALPSMRRPRSRTRSIGSPGRVKAHLRMQQRRHVLDDPRQARTRYPDEVALKHVNPPRF